jgi:hypothetical protein
MQAVAESEGDGLRANIDAFARLLQLADRLRRTNSAKWGITREDWLCAVQTVLNLAELRPCSAAKVTESIRLAHLAVRRLANSGEARLCSPQTTRHPDSSEAGRRFYEA